jgi:SAM-dependent methyltransferase
VAEQDADHYGVHFTQEFWDDRYRSAHMVWSGKPNPQLVAQTADLDPGDALDAGCGEGADAIWLASHGWTVTAVDISAVALAKAALQAAAHGDAIANRIRWRREDLLSWAPDAQEYDLVSAQFMHLPGPAQQAMYRRLAASVRPGGTLVVVGHDQGELHAGVARPAHGGAFLSAAQVAALLDPADWQVAVAAEIARSVTDVEGRLAELTDTVLRAARR